VNQLKGCRSPIQLVPISREQLLGRVASLARLYRIRASVVNRFRMFPLQNTLRGIESNPDQPETSNNANRKAYCERPC